MLNLLSLMSHGITFVKKIYKMDANFKKKIFWINPNKIHYFSPPPNWWWYARLEKRTKNKFLKKIIKNIAMGNIIYRGDWDKKLITFVETDWSKKIKDLKINIQEFENSMWYQSIIKDIELFGFHNYKDFSFKNIVQVKFFFKNYLLEVIDSLSKHGYIIENDNFDDIPKALIGRNGELIKSGNGCHRLAIIRCFNIKCEYPIQIVAIHKNFFSKEDLNESYIEKFINNNYK